MSITKFFASVPSDRMTVTLLSFLSSSIYVFLHVYTFRTHSEREKGRGRKIWKAKGSRASVAMKRETRNGCDVGRWRTRLEVGSCCPRLHERTKFSPRTTARESKCFCVSRRRRRRRRRGEADYESVPIAVSSRRDHQFFLRPFALLV